MKIERRYSTADCFNDAMSLLNVIIPKLILIPIILAIVTKLSVAIDYNPNPLSPRSNTKLVNLCCLRQGVCQNRQCEVVSPGKDQP